MKAYSYIFLIVLTLLFAKTGFSEEINEKSNSENAESENNKADDSREWTLEEFTEILGEEIEEAQYQGFSVFTQTGEENLNAICTTLTFASILGYNVDKFAFIKAFLEIAGEPWDEGYSELEIVQVLDELKILVPINPNTGKSSWKRGNLEKLIKTLEEYGPTLIRLEDVIFAHFILILKYEADKFYYFDSADSELKVISTSRIETFWDKTYLHSREKMSEEVKQMIGNTVEKSKNIAAESKNSFGYHYFLKPSEDYFDLSLTLWTDFVSADLELLFAYGFGGLTEDSYTEIYFGGLLGIWDFSNFTLGFELRAGILAELVLNPNTTVSDTKHILNFNFEPPTLLISKQSTEFSDWLLDIGYSLVLRPFAESIEWSIRGHLGYKSFFGSSYFGVPYFELSLIYNKFLVIGKFNKQYFEISYRIEPVIIGETIESSVFQVLRLRYSGSSSFYYSVALEFSLDADDNFTLAAILTLGTFN